jgi:uncharacterized protein YkuJ
MDVGDRQQLIDENEGSNQERQRQFEKEQQIKQRVKSSAPTTA